MAVYLSVLFVFLIAQMGGLLFLSLPLPTLLRNCIVKVYDKFLYKSSQVKTILLVMNCIVLSLFLDSYKRANVKLPLSDSGIPLQPELLVTKAYHQRNVYISGFILYYMICIPFMIRLISKVVKVTSKRAPSTGSEDTVMVSALKSKLDGKIKSLEVLQKQYENKKAFVDNFKFSQVTEDIATKKEK